MKELAELYKSNAIRRFNKGKKTASPERSPSTMKVSDIGKQALKYGAICVSLTILVSIDIPFLHYFHLTHHS